MGSPDYDTSKVKKILTEFGEPNMSLHKLRHSTYSQNLSYIINRYYILLQKY